MASRSSCVVLALCLALALLCPVAFVNSATKVAQQQEVSVARGASEQDGIPSSASNTSTGSYVVGAVAAVSAMFGLLKSKKKSSCAKTCCSCPTCPGESACCCAGIPAPWRNQVATAAAAAVVGVSTAANAMVDYSGLAYLGGSDKVDINNANVQAYRQFPGMYPTIAGLIGSNGPYKSVSDVYNVPGLTEPMKSVLKQYEGNLVCFPADPAYFIDRVNNGLYR
mmetsp:Transcript_63015/g.117205  ORF Transcript_63015/g.117205 Transcript_63015/m.117205 type:complete len:224 (+) Transcript_63015:82-753(+)